MRYKTNTNRTTIGYHLKLGIGVEPIFLTKHEFYYLVSEVWCVQRPWEQYEDLLSNIGVQIAS